MIDVLVIGIGSGNPAYLTGEAVAALNRVDVFLVADKRADTSDLAAMRRSLCEVVINNHDYRIVEIADPVRAKDDTGYLEAVADWHARRSAAYAEVVRRELPAGGTLGFLVWGDPAFYDSTLRIVEQLSAGGIELQTEVFPGISSIQLLAARHRMILNAVGGPVHITTGRRLAAEFDPGLGTVVVILDGDLSCRALIAQYPDLEIIWGAQLGLPDETLLRGRLADVIDEITAIRRQLRTRRGWVMDIYALVSVRDR